MHGRWKAAPLVPRTSSRREVVPPNLAEVATVDDPVYLSMSNEIHHIVYTGDSIQVRRYVRRMPKTQLFEYQCLIWPKLGLGYTEMSTTFSPHGMERYGWNRCVFTHARCMHVH